MVVPLTQIVKWLIIINVAIWIVLQIIIGKNFFPGLIEYLFGLVPEKVISSFFIWQPFTYLFLHSVGQISHIVFNMLMLWFLGSELEMRWGGKFFLTYYLFTGVGAALIYIFFIAAYSLAVGDILPLKIPVIGASGSIFGLMMAYGMIFGERIIYFMFLFPMRAKYFVLILGVIELMTLLSSGVAGSSVANLAHLGGLMAGFLFLLIYTRLQRYRLKKRSQTQGRNLRLVVDNEEKQKGPPRYWH